jgi:hypothetical protein
MASAEETPVVKFVEVLFREAVTKRASDVHIEPGEQTTNVRLRIDGVLQRLLTISRRMHPAVVSRIKILSGMNIAERRRPQDGQFSIHVEAKDIDFLLTLGELFTLVAYGQLIIEYRNMYRNEISDDLLEQIFDVMERDFSKFALQLYSKPSSTRKQREICLKMIMKPVTDTVRFERIWKEHVYALKGAYRMND